MSSRSIGLNFPEFFDFLLSLHVYHYPDPFDLRVLLVEDDPDDALLVREAIAEAGATGIELRREDRLEAGIRLLRSERFDVALLDLALPDAAGLETLHRLRRACPGLPVVVLTGADDAALALRAVRSGAQDYLVKGRFGNETLVRAMRYAAERRRLESRLEAARQRERRERELRELDRLAPLPRSENAGAGSNRPIRERRPEIFDRLARAYDDLLSRALDARLFRTDDDPADAVREFGERLCGLGAGARDAVDVHAEAIRSRMRTANPEKARACLEEGRMVLMQLLGDLADGYRRRAAAPDRGKGRSR